MERIRNIRKMIVALVLTAVSLPVYSQLKVTSNGNIGIGSDNPLSKLSVNSDGNALYGAYVLNPTPAEWVVSLLATTSVLPPSSSINNYKYRNVLGSISSGNGYAFGLYGQSVNGTPRTSGRAFGVYGEAANATSGYNFGVIGALSGSNNGAGVYGATYGPAWGEDTEGRFAGYFSGGVYVSEALTIGKKSTNYSLDVDGDACVVSLYESSDARLKENVLGLSSALEKLRKLRGVTYTFKKPEVKSSGLANLNDTGTVNTNTKTVDLSRYTKKRIGFIAQELQVYYPELVRESGDGMLAVDYVGLIPVIIEAIKEQDSIITALRLELESIRPVLLSSTIEKQNSPITSLESDASTTNAALYQNAPNPFNTSTVIRYYLPSNVQQATIYLFNMEGTLLQTMTSLNRGQGSITIRASELKPGMYIYSLVTDGKEIDSKRMILTE